MGGHEPDTSQAYSLGELLKENELKNQVFINISHFLRIQTQHFLHSSCVRGPPESSQESGHPWTVSSRTILQSRRESGCQLWADITRVVRPVALGPGRNPLPAVAVSVDGSCPWPPGWSPGRTYPDSKDSQGPKSHQTSMKTIKAQHCRCFSQWQIQF